MKRIKTTGSGLLAAAAAAALLAGCNPALAAGDAAAGKRTADVWCVGCHLVGGEQKAGLADVPPFPTIAREKTPGAIRAFLFNPHPPMPQFRLTTKDIDDLVAFIESLKK
ncbi:MAG: c-type cytochrome [Rhodospirillales bacterium]